MMAEASLTRESCFVLPVVVTDFNKVLAGQARNTERFYIVGGIHRGELVVSVVDKPVETVARLCGHAVVVDEDMMAHAQLGDNNLLIYAGIGGLFSGHPASSFRSRG